MGRVKLKSAFEHVQYKQIQIILRTRKVSSVHSIVVNDSVSGQQMPWSDCAQAQALRKCPKDVFKWRGKYHTLMSRNVRITDLTNVRKRTTGSTNVRKRTIGISAVCSESSQGVFKIAMDAKI